VSLHAHFPFLSVKGISQIRRSNIIDENGIDRESVRWSRVEIYIKEYPMRKFVTNIVTRIVRGSVRHRVAVLNAVVISLVAAGATVVAMRNSKEKAIELPSTNIQAINRDSESRVASQTVAQNAGHDGQTGQTRPLTSAEAQKLAEGVKELVSQSDEGLTEVRHNDGSVSVDLNGRFQNVMLATKNEDGTLNQACVNNPQNAAQFLGLDPQLISNSPADKTGSKRKAAAKAAVSVPTVKEELK
jgi:hypothetical protein